MITQKRIEEVVRTIVAFECQALHDQVVWRNDPANTYLPETFTAQVSPACWGACWLSLRFHK